MYVVRTRCVDYHYMYMCDFLFGAANQSGMHADCTGIASCIMRTIYLYTVQACCVENLIHYLFPYNSEHLVHIKSFLELLVLLYIPYSWVCTPWPCTRMVQIYTCLRPYYVYALNATPYRVHVLHNYRAAYVTNKLPSTRCTRLTTSCNSQLSQTIGQHRLAMQVFVSCMTVLRDKHGVMGLTRTRCPLEYNYHNGKCRSEPLASMFLGMSSRSLQHYKQ